MNINEDVKIILPTNSSYLDIIRNFLDVLHVNWPEHPEVIISIAGEPMKINMQNVIYNGSDATLTDCIYNVAKLFDKNTLFFCFLGDAFITNKIDNKFIKQIISEIHEYQINYCSLIYHNSRKIKLVQRHLRYVNSNDRYNISFIGFIATFKFIEKEFKCCTNDYEFEVKYLKKNNKKENIFYDDIAIVLDDKFGILPSIKKGKWLPGRLKKLKKQFPYIEFSKKRKCVSIFEEFFINLSNLLIYIIPNKWRILIKKFLKKTKIYYSATDY